MAKEEEPVTTEKVFNEEEHNKEMISKVEALEKAQEAPKADDEDTEEPTENEDTEDSEEEEVSQEEDTPEEEEVEKVLEEAGLNMEDLEAEFEKDGQLSSESYLALERAGIPRSTVDNYISGIQAQSELIELKAYEAVGGKERYQALAGWAADNLSEDEIEAFNSTLSNPTGAQFKLALAGLQARYEASNGSMTDNLIGKGRASPDVFESMEQLRVAMSDPRYAKDTAYQRQVAAKLQRSNLM